MKTILTLMLALSLFLTWSHVEAQGTRYLDEVFDEVQIDTGIPYATNISVLTGTPQPVDLLMDVYTPAGDTEDNRPVMIVFHSGFFLPQYNNGSVYGSLQDSSVVNTCKRLARRGYVAVAASYRLGWNPLSHDQDIVTSGFLNAVYRSIQDARACMRFLRMTVAEEANPYGIDPDNIGLWGIGSAGYTVYGSAFLDRYEEFLLPRFFNQNLEPYINNELSGDPFGLNEASLNIPNHVAYSSGFKFGLNMGGALLDTSWIEGSASPIPEPNIVGFHVVSDPWTPFGTGQFSIPPDLITTFSFVYGTRLAIEKLNVLGGNAELDAALDTNPDFPLNTFMTTYMAALSEVPFTDPLGQFPTTLSTKHMYSFIPPPDETFPIRIESHPWNWYDQATLDTVIAALNMELPTEPFDAEALHQNELLINPDMSAEKGNRYLDSIFAYAMPRACLSFGLSECLTVGTEDVIDPVSVDLKLFPNPAVEQLTIQTGFEHPIREVHLFDLGGRMVRSDFNINTATYQLRREHLPSGLYFAKIKLDEGWVVQKLSFK